MIIELVVARYNENLDWLKKIDKHIKITIYNKGINNINMPFIQLQNIGRESHTYLYHIIHNYNNLADITIFCQGDTIFHSPDFLNLIKLYDKFQPIQALSAFYWPEGVPPHNFNNPPISITDLTKNEWLDGNKIHVEYLDNDFITHYPAHYFEYNFNNYVNRKIKTLYNVDNVLQFNITRFNLPNISCDELFPICYAGIFAVKKNVILDQCVDYYNNIMNILIYDVRYYKDKIIDHGQFLEKLWLVIFNYKKYNPNYISLKTSDFKLNNYSLYIKNNSIKFKYYIIFCQILINLVIDNITYTLFISRYNIYLSIHQTSHKKYLIDYKYNHKGNNLVNGKTKNKINFNKLLHSNKEIEININLLNNILFVNIDKINIIKIKINKQNINSCNINNISNDNKFIDLLQ